jgi:cytochrome c oxidase subunit 3
MPKFLVTRHQRGMAIFLCVDLAVFFTLFVAYVYLRVRAQEWPPAFHFGSGLMAFAIAIFAMSTNFTMFYAARYQAQAGYEIAERLVIASIAVIGSVIIMLSMEWMRLLYIIGATFTRNPWGVPAFSWTYFGLTGFYALHLAALFIYLTAVAARIKKSDAGSCALFTYFTNLVWLIILFGVYFTTTDLQGI